MNFWRTCITRVTAAAVPLLAGAAICSSWPSAASANVDQSNPAVNSIKNDGKPESGTADNSNNDRNSEKSTAEQHSARYGVCFTRITTEALKKLIPQRHKEYFHGKFMALEANAADLEAAVGTVCSVVRNCLCIVFACSISTF